MSVQQDQVSVWTESSIFSVSPQDSSVGKALDDVVGKKEMVTACGYTTWGAECSHFQVYSVQPVGEAAKSVEKGL